MCCKLALLSQNDRQDNNQINFSKWMKIVNADSIQAWRYNTKQK